MNIKNNIYGVFALGMVMASLSLSSCAGDEELSSSLDASKDKISTSADVSFGGNETTAEIKIEASGLWNISGIPDWFILDKTQGTGDAYINLTTTDSENPSALNDRIATLALNSETRQKEIVVKQSKANEYLNIELDGNGINFPRDMESLEQQFQIKNNSQWRILETADWYTASPMEGKGSATIKITVKKIEKDWDNEHNMTITTYRDEDGYTPKTQNIKIFQQGISTTLAMGQSKIEVDALEGTSTLVLTGDASWIATVDVAWLKLSKLSGKGGENLQLEYTTNETAGPREANITITTSTQTLTCQIVQAVASVPTCAEPTKDKVEKYGFTVSSSYSSVIPVTEYGIVYSLNPNPTVADNKISCTDGTNPFTLSASGLLSGKTFYVRSYARNGAGYGYSDEITVTTGGVKPGENDNPTPNL